MPLSWPYYERSHLLVAPTPVGFAYHYALTLLAELRGFLFRIAAAKTSVCALLSLSMSVLLGDPVDYIHVFDGATAFVESDVPLPLQ